MSKAVITCAVTGVLTNPAQHPVPVTPAEMATAAKEAYDAGASVMHVHFRMQEPGMGHLPSWQPEVAATICSAIRDACPGVIINMTTGVMGNDISGPEACMREVKPEVAACNAGSLNYLKTRRDGSWAWPPMLFDNPVSKVEKFLKVMNDTGSKPEFECFDVGIVRSIQLFQNAGLAPKNPEVNLVMGVASGMPVDGRLLELLSEYVPDDAVWQTTLIGRQEIWPVHRRAAELGGMLRTGVEDTFYMPNGEKCRGNGDLIEALVATAREAGREIASPSEARELLHLN